MRPAQIYHLTEQAALSECISAGEYSPASLPEDGFVHCSAGRDTTLAVANDYFSSADGPVVLLEIEVSRLSSDVVYEAAAQIEGGEASHLATAVEFPHVYGPIDTEAIRAAGILGKTAGGFEWPQTFDTLDAITGD
jgi:uncharacterized protein (DUF952 family)